jgi:hypothetical protein
VETIDFHTTDGRFCQAVITPRLTLTARYRSRGPAGCVAGRTAQRARGRPQPSGTHAGTASTSNPGSGASISDRRKNKRPLGRRTNGTFP